MSASGASSSRLREAERKAGAHCGDGEWQNAASWRSNVPKGACTSMHGIYLGLHGAPMSLLLGLYHRHTWSLWGMSRSQDVEDSSKTQTMFNNEYISGLWAHVREYVCLYTYIYIYTHVYVYTYIYIEREAHIYVACVGLNSSRILRLTKKTQADPQQYCLLLNPVSVTILMIGRPYQGRT